MKKSNLVIVIICFVIFLGILSFMLVYRPNIKILILEEKIQINSLFFNDEITYDDIEEMFIVENIEVGRRKIGFNMSKVTIGVFHNQMFSTYRLYKQNDILKLIVIKYNGQYIVFNNSYIEEIFNKIEEKIGDKQ